MINSSVYLKMRVLGAVDTAPGKGEFYFNETSDTLLNAFRSAVYKRGLPEQLYVDNGAIYTCKEIVLTCARLGIILSHAPVRDGAAKGKIERFFRTVREDFLSRNLDLSSLETLNKSFIVWVEDEYNSRTHSTIQMKPIDRFGLDLKRIKFMPLSDASEEIFFVEEVRSVRADNTFFLRNIRFESPSDLANRKIQVRFNRKLFDPNKVVIYYKQQRLGHNTLTQEALSLIVRSSEGIIRRARNITLSCLLDAIRDQTKTVDLKHVNNVLRQPHWRNSQDIFSSFSTQHPPNNAAH